MGRLGKPIYKLDDMVSFEYYGKTYTGKMGIVDAYGTTALRGSCISM
ncbi:hypothetical protein SAMN02910292_03108 [Lachnospiraceae bacterium XBB2008]|nr:hypothetical protein SAMN02910292_03108 [Lachnospiraceae bacterium XBB2008]